MKRVVTYNTPTLIHSSVCGKAAYPRIVISTTVPPQNLNFNFFFLFPNYLYGMMKSQVTIILASVTIRLIIDGLN